MSTATVAPVMVGQRVRVRREVTALRPTREWTGSLVWEGTVTDVGVRDAASGELRGLCVLTAREHTWIALGVREDTMRDGKACRRWVTVLEVL